MTKRRKRSTAPHTRSARDPEFVALQRKQLDAQLGADARLRQVVRPAGGWIRTIRTALGMTLDQLGARIGVSRQGAQEVEKREADDSITIASLRRAAEALNCSVVIALVPATSLEDTITARARAVATDERNRLAHSMRLEDQHAGLDDAASVDGRVKALTTTGLRRLWD